MLAAHLQQDEYGTVFNSPDTFYSLAAKLYLRGKVAFAWTDQEGTQLDILMMYEPDYFGSMQGGVRANDLFISIMRMGAFAFSVELNPDTYEGYYSEKLGRELGSGNSTSIKLAELINNVRHELARMKTV